MIKTSKFKYDTIGRKDIIINLSKMILSHNDPFVLNINGKWGSGKTTFVKLWQEYLEDEYKLKSIYFSAWEDDFSQEPLISILGEIQEHLKNLKVESDIQEKFNNVKNIAAKVITKSLPAFLKGATQGFLDIDKGFELAISALSESSALELIERHSESKNQILQFKNLLSEIVKELNSDFPLILFIDELDRCRPTYAIELLERIKHIFGIENVVFVLSTDKTQLSQSIKVLYGDIDTDNYLRRFIDLEFNLPNITDITKYLTLLEAQYSVTQGLENQNLEHSRFMRVREKLMEPLYYNLELSLRQVEEIYRYQRIIYWSSHKSFLQSFVFVLPVLLSLKIYDDALYKDLIHYKADKKSILKLLLADDSTFIEKEDKYLIEAVILYTVSTDEDEIRLVNRLQNDLKDSKSQEEAEKIGYLITISEKIFGNNSFSQEIRKAINKIEFIDLFSFSNEDVYNDSMEEL